MAELEANNSAAGFEISAEAGTATVAVRGELDVANIGALAAAVEPVIEREPKRLIVDCGALRFADSSAIALLVRWSTRVGQIELRNPSPLLRKVITSMGLSETLTLVP